MRALAISSRYGRSVSLAAPALMPEDTMGEIEKNVSRIREKIEQAAAKVGREARGIKLMAVTKTVSVEMIREAMAAGVTIFGENYVQEATAKVEEIGRSGIQGHLIGPP